MLNSVKTFVITQANTHEFRDLYIRYTMLVLVESGTKTVHLESGESLHAHAGDLLIFPAGSCITVENRIHSGKDYRAQCIVYNEDCITEVFPTLPQYRPLKPIHVTDLPPGLKATLESTGNDDTHDSSPHEIIRHRLLEPLIWLKSMHFNLATPKELGLDIQLRNLIHSDPAYQWTATSASKKLSLGESTMRRRLQELRTSFSKILMDVRLEFGLTLLQSTQAPITKIALDCGFATPSHFSDSFKKRFLTSPKCIRKQSQ